MPTTGHVQECNHNRVFGYDGILGKTAAGLRPGRIDVYLHRPGGSVQRSGLSHAHVICHFELEGDMAGVRTDGNTPVRKVTFGALAAAIAGLLVWALNTYVPFFQG